MFKLTLMTLLNAV